MSEWQPIETAPKDGQWFVITRQGEEDSYEVGQYRPYYFDRYVPTEDGLYYQKKPELLGEWCGFSNFHRATHWAPLPKPPGEA